MRFFDHLIKKGKLTAALLALLCALTLTVGCVELDSAIPHTTSDITLDNSSITTDADISSGTDTQNSSVNDPPVISDKAPTNIKKAPELDLSSIPAYTGAPYTIINNNTPFFEKDEYTTATFELYSSLDSLGRCGTAYANVCKETMPTEERGSISSVKPSGWQSVQYDCVDGKYLYNRAHLIGWQLTAENANKQNLITGTRYFNVDGMLPFENMVADYVKEENNHVLYRVTPIFAGNDLVAAGVLMEAYSVEDNGEGLSFCVFCYNVQPGVSINYADGTSHLSGDGQIIPDTSQSTSNSGASGDMTYILNTNTKKFHYPNCHSAESISDKNKQSYTGDRQELIDDGYSPCGNCDP